MHEACLQGHDKVVYLLMAFSAEADATSAVIEGVAASKSARITFSFFALALLESADLRRRQRAL